MEYQINPLWMGGLVRQISDNMVKIHLHGRLGVITVPREAIAFKGDLEPGHDIHFYFSYLQVTDYPYEYDCTAMKQDGNMIPCLLGGKLTEVNDTAVKAEIVQNLGTIAVPRRWVFTPVKLEIGQYVEFYFSSIKATEKREAIRGV